MKICRFQLERCLQRDIKSKKNWISKCVYHLFPRWLRFSVSFHKYFSDCVPGRHFSPLTWALPRSWKICSIPFKQGWSKAFKPQVVYSIRIESCSLSREKLLVTFFLSFWMRLTTSLAIPSFSMLWSGVVSSKIRIWQLNAKAIRLPG
mgnify:FL=1